MTDLLDELQKKTNKRVTKTVQSFGGDLLDELAIKTGRRDEVSPAMMIRQQEAERDRILKERLDALNKDLGVLDRIRVGIGRGFTTIGRGVGILDPEGPAERQGFEQLADESIAFQAGEVVGEAAPFLAAAPLSGAGLVTTTAGGAARTLIPQATRAAPRIAGAAGLGAAEGGIITAGRNGSTAEQVLGAGVGGVVAGSVEALMPVLSRLGRQVFRRFSNRAPQGDLLTPEGLPTPEFQAALDATGTNFDDLTAEAVSIVNQQGVNPQQAARTARLQSQDIPATAGDITQDFAQQAEEQRLLSQASAEAGEPLRQLKLGQSEAFRAKVNELVDSLGVPDDAGGALKEALEGRKKLLQREKNALYAQVAETAPEVARVPLVTDSIESAIPDKDLIRDIADFAPTAVQATEKLLARFGIIKDPNELQRLGISAEEIRPLNLGNFETFRQRLNLFERSDPTRAVSVITGPIKNALDNEAQIVDNAVKDLSISDVGVLDTLRQARERVRTLKTEFSPQSITGRLIGVKRDGVTPVVEASKVTQELLRPNAPIENLQRTVTSLENAGKEGAKAIKDLQASVVLNALEAALKAPSRKTSGIETIGGEQFAKSLSQFGDDKLRVLFKNDKKALNRLLNLKQSALDISPAATATPKGSAPVILDLVQRAGTLPGLAAVRDMVQLVVRAGADERAVRKAIESKPSIKRTISAFETDFPAITSALGIPSVLPQTQEERSREAERRRQQ